MLVGPYASYGPGYDYVGGTGWNSGKRKVDAVDLFTDGGFDLFGRQHNLMIGGSYSKQNNRYLSSWANVFPDEIGSFSGFNAANFPETNWGPQSLAQDDTTRMKSLYAATRFAGRSAALNSWRSLYQLAYRHPLLQHGEKPYDAVRGPGLRHR